MSPSDQDVRYYLRIRGKILGPYGLSQLQMLSKRGQLTQMQEISRDGKNWRPASTLDELFSGDSSAGFEGDPSSETGTIPLRNDGILAGTWYYSVEGQQLGPVPLSELTDLVYREQLSARDLVWTEGMSEWRRAGTIEPLRPIFASRREATRKASPQGNSEIVLDNDSKEPIEESLPPHFMDHVLEGLRGLVSDSLMRKAGTTAVEFGRYTLYAGIGLNLIMDVAAAYKVKSALPAWIGLGATVIAIVLHFSAIKSCGAIAQLIRRSPVRMSSTAFLDSLVVISFFGGLIGVVGGIVTWHFTQDLSKLLIGIAIFLCGEELALVLLHPAAIGVTISRKTSSGEDAIAILSLLMILPLRFVPAVFALAAASTVLNSLLGLYLISSHVESKSVYQLHLLVTSENMSLLTVASIPLIAYVYFVFAYLIVDLIRSILVMPHKIDELAVVASRKSES